MSYTNVKQPKLFVVLFLLCELVTVLSTLELRQKKHKKGLCDGSLIQTSVSLNHLVKYVNIVLSYLATLLNDRLLIAP